MNAGNYYNLSQIPVIYGFYQNQIEYFAQLGYNLMSFDQQKRYFDQRLIDDAIEVSQDLIYFQLYFIDVALKYRTWKV
jgi:hypothetical protein